jgi:hypothetical protein
MTNLINTMADLYDAGPGVFNPISILWASEKVADKIGIEATKAELKKLNRQRERLGLPVAVHEFGHRLF